ncbi:MULTISPECIES: serine/threonine-protein kinase [unclassified Thermosynechococcus]|uniref:serine/threonine-protein kinase n=1 Tax=unclassified Thermosynechococcus TaxID=2622553 RepID=UPI0025778AB5|nr:MULTISPECIES: serine/threonine-protein kinase [unclassified Thermosynechococcus]WJI27562.1 serine/threonine protein kinase [Thermosynechococcus sp. B1]WKT84680.1 serine/threonine-protein kinase [Thermosynechococcus sp. HY596]WNC63815.1 serine/threonine-protein kinase [Thermosynechococcus sp. HY591]WNC66379.1 serine/threonine-protein kinase [Thermosynechococcus sp. HY593]
MATARTAQTSRYRLVDLAGQGQYGKVYLAVNRESGDLVAIKVLSEQQLLTRGFLRELNFLLTLQHPHVVGCQAIDYIRVRHSPQVSRSLVMDYCAGGTLRSLLEQEQALPLTTALRLTLDILAALAYAHHRGILHCDLKPENILLEVTATGWQAKVSDFGVARLIEDVKGSGQTGSPAYMAPERFYGQTLPASDLYAVGILMYEMIVGDRPFHGTPAELMTAHLSRPYTLPEGLPFLVRSIITKALDKLPQRRYKSAAEMTMAVQLALEVIEAERHEQPLLFSRSPAAVWLGEPQGYSLAIPPQQVASTATRFYGVVGDRLWAWQARETVPEEMGQWPLPPLPIQLYGGEVSTWLRINVLPPQLFCIHDQLIPLDCRLHSSLNQLAIDATGYWCAETEIDSAAAELQLHVQLINGQGQRTLRCQWYGRTFVDTLLLNRRYGVVISRSHHPETEHATTHFQLFDRRGHWRLYTQLPAHLTLLTPAHHQPWQLAAFEDHPQQPLLMLLHLRPWRVQRLGLRFRPQFLCATPWGYVVAGRHRLNLVTHGGEIVGTAESEQEICGLGFTGDRHLWLIRHYQDKYVLQTWDIATWEIDLIL